MLTIERWMEDSKAHAAELRRDWLPHFAEASLFPPRHGGPTLNGTLRSLMSNTGLALQCRSEVGTALVEQDREIVESLLWAPMGHVRNFAASALQMPPGLEMRLDRRTLPVAAIEWDAGDHGAEIAQGLRSRTVRQRWAADLVTIASRQADQHFTMDLQDRLLSISMEHLAHAGTT